MSLWWSKVNKSSKNKKNNFSFNFGQIFKLNKKKNHKTILKNKSDAKNRSNNIQSIFNFNFSGDAVLFTFFAFIILIGILIIFSASVVSASFYTSDKFWFFFNHIEKIIVGIVFFCFFYFICTDLLIKFSIFGFLTVLGILIFLSILALLGVVESVDGAARWIEIFGIQFQPSDFLKLFLILLGAKAFSKIERYPSLKDYLRSKEFKILILIVLSIILVLVGNTNLGTSIVLFSILIAIYFVSPLNRWKILVIITFLLLGILGGVLFINLFAYRMDRIAVWYEYITTGNSRFLDCPNNPDCSYHFHNTLITCGSGGLFGVGAGKSIGKYFLPKTSSSDDSVFCIMAEEHGFLVVSVVLGLLFFIAWRMVETANRIKNMEYKIILVGTSVWIFIQTFLHIGSNIGLTPMTGQTLPFISLGGSSIVSLMSAMGICIRVTGYKNEE